MVKVPSFFKKTITETVLKKKYLKYIEYHDDKNFIRACYAEDDDGASGNLRLRQDLSEKDVLRLKGLVKAIKGNRKAAVKIIPLAVAAAVIASIAVFFAVMANPLLQRGLETALEAVFQARVNASRFRISLFRLEMAMDSLTIADRDSPMRNLIQFSAMKIRFSPQAAIRGRVYIEEIRADNIRFGTARTVSGALPARAPKPPSEREAIEIPPLVDVQNFDATALLNREFDRLQTPRLHSAAVESYQTSVARWQGEQAAVRARVEEIQSRAEPLLAININDFRVVDLQTAEQTLARIRTTIDQTNAMISTVQDAQNDVNRIASGVEADMNTARALEQNARNAFQADFNRLRSFIDLGSGTAMEVLEAIVMSIVTDSAMEYVTYGQRALEILQTVRAAQEKLPRSSRPPRAARFRGRDVQFAANKYPRFFMGIMATDVLTTSGWHWGFDLRGVSSDPDISAVPTTLSLTLAETDAALNRRGALNAQADLRSDATERFNAEFSGAGFPVNISAGLDSIGAGGFSGGAAFSLNAAGNVDGGFSTGGNISFVQARLENPSNSFTNAVAQAVAQVEIVQFGINYEHVLDGQDNFSVTTNFGDIFMDAAKRIASQYARQAEEALEKALQERIDQFVESVPFVGKEEMGLLYSAVRGDQAAVSSLTNILNGKRNELEERLRTAAEEAARQAAGNLIDSIAPQLPAVPGLPGLPAIPGLRR